MTAIAVLGHLARDVVAGGAPRPGGAVLYSAQALARIGADANVGASCAAADRAELLPALEAFGLPTEWYESTTTAAYSFHYEGDRGSCGRTPSATLGAEIERSRPPATPSGSTSARSPEPTFPPRRARGARRRRPLVARRRPGARAGEPTSGRSGRTERSVTCFAHVEILKLNDEEAETLVGSAEPESLHSLGVPEVILTLGSHGSYVITPHAIEHVPAEVVSGPVDPTGAGDTFSATYLTRRSAGAEPVEAARAATETVAEFLAN